jgi:hypothetical protein
MKRPAPRQHRGMTATMTAVIVEAVALSTVR